MTIIAASYVYYRSHSLQIDDYDVLDTSDDQDDADGRVNIFTEKKLVKFTKSLKRKWYIKRRSGGEYLQDENAN